MLGHHGARSLGERPLYSPLLTDPRAASYGAFLAGCNVFTNRQAAQGPAPGRPGVRPAPAGGSGEGLPALTPPFQSTGSLNSSSCACMDSVSPVHIEQHCI